ncbi:7-cyano-7-deazaguanine synthase [Vibrio vulnificus]|uniref:7-cyano-7-deazaguanine synthase n=1 Tax=Vibrio vulnificus TaxID=672 RepID=UPI000C7D9EFF|nr:7-cyano-7-deazaguanine synthase [Vibrio vulnificus]AUL97449.1 Queuosine Biosynthesis QueC ATPase [Vibrio vulnificus]MCU8340403.1 7-cyano-7-deazaguanine synthase [Vibrio vulnificus]HAS8144339.1 7-cyano-7-deazaguanine synthase [Vibrio vulnificus]
MPKSKNKEVVISLSGGLDSTVLAYYLKDQGYKLISAFIDFGTDSSQRELAAAKYFAMDMRIPFEVIDFRGLGGLIKAYGFVGQLDGGDSPDPDPEFGADADNLMGASNDMFVPTAFYNTIAPITYLSRVLNVNRIAVGIIENNVKARPSSSEFFKSWEKIIPNFDASERSKTRGFEVLLPFEKMDKSQVIHEAIRLGVPLDTTFSCYKGRTLHCGTCSSCKERIKAFKDAKVEDPTWYEKSPYVAGPQTRKR